MQSMLHILVCEPSKYLTHSREFEQSYQSIGMIFLSIRLEQVECTNHERENVTIFYPSLEGSKSKCPLCEARYRIDRLEAQYEHAMRAAHDLAELVVGKKR